MYKDLKMHKRVLTIKEKTDILSMNKEDRTRNMKKEQKIC